MTVEVRVQAARRPGRQQSQWCCLVPYSRAWAWKEITLLPVVFRSDASAAAVLILSMPGVGEGAVETSASVVVHLLGGEHTVRVAGDVVVSWKVSPYCIQSIAMQIGEGGGHGRVRNYTWLGEGRHGVVVRDKRVVTGARIPPEWYFRKPVMGHIHGQRCVEAELPALVQFLDSVAVAARDTVGLRLTGTGMYDDLERLAVFLACWPRLQRYTPDAHSEDAWSDIMSWPGVPAGSTVCYDCEDGVLAAVRVARWAVSLAPSHGNSDVRLYSSMLTHNYAVWACILRTADGEGHTIILLVDAHVSNGLCRNGYTFAEAVASARKANDSVRQTVVVDTTYHVAGTTRGHVGVSAGPVLDHIARRVGVVTDKRRGELRDPVGFYGSLFRVIVNPHRIDPVRRPGKARSGLVFVNSDLREAGVAVDDLLRLSGRISQCRLVSLDRRMSMDDEWAATQQTLLLPYPLQCPAPVHSVRTGVPGGSSGASEIHCAINGTPDQLHAFHDQLSRTDGHNHRLLRTAHSSTADSNRRVQHCVFSEK